MLNNDSLNIIRALTFKRILNYLKLVLSYFLSVVLRKNYHKGYPAVLAIEPSAVCQLKCPQCPVGTNSLKRPKGFMTLENFKEVLAPNADNFISLILYFQGEPFLNKQLTEMLAYAKSLNLYTLTSTNAQSIDKEIAKAIVQSGLDKIIISLDGVDESSYTAYRKNGRLDNVLNSIKYILHHKKELKSKTPFVEVQFLVLKSNEEQLPKIKALCEKNGVDRLRIKTAQIYDFNKDGKQFIPLNSKYSRYKKKGDSYVIKSKLPNRCFKMWHAAVVTWDGDLLPCCFDKDARYAFGNVLQHKLKDVWESAPYNSFRNEILRNRKAFEMCCNCTS